MYTRSFTPRAVSVALVFASLAACSDQALGPSDRLSTQRSAALSAPGTVTAIDLGVLPGDNYVSHANALNNKDEVVGRSWHIAEPGVELGRAFFWEPDGPNATTGQMTALVMPFGMPESSDAIDINDKGVAAGWSRTPFVAKVAVLWKDGLGSPLPDVDGNPAVNAGAVAINNRGDVVIQSGTNVLLWTPDFEGARTGSSVLLGTFNARSINDRREVVGASIGLGAALVWRPDAPGATTGTLSDLGSLGGSENVALDINNHGDVAFGLSGHAELWRR
jgi:uncharacterized membrane protein